MKTTGNLKKSTFAVLALTLTLLGGGPAELRAVEADLVDPVASSESYYANPAQAAHAAQLAEQAAMSDPDVLAALDEVEAAQAEVDAAQAAFDALEPEDGVTPTPAEEAALEAARQDLLDAQTNLGIMEDTYTDAVAAATGVNASEIEALRTAGMGWGDIAHELGVHPSTLGLGHGKKTGTQAEVTTSTTAIDGIEAEELAEATARNTRNGWSQEKDHLNTQDRDQLTTRSRIHEPGTGLTAAGATAAGHSKAERNADATGDGNTTAGSGNGGGNTDNSGNGNSNSGGNDHGGGNDNANGNSGGNDHGGGNDNANGNSGGNDHGGGNDNANGNGGGNDHGGGKK